MLVVSPGLADRLVVSSTEQLLSSYEAPEEEKEQAVVWSSSQGPDYEKGIRLTLTHPKVLSSPPPSQRLAVPSLKLSALWCPVEGLSFLQLTETSRNRQVREVSLLSPSKAGGKTS